MNINLEQEGTIQLTTEREWGEGGDTQTSISFPPPISCKWPNSSRTKRARGLGDAICRGSPRGPKTCQKKVITI